MKDTKLRRQVTIYVLWEAGTWSAEPIELTEDDCDLADDAACGERAEARAHELFGRRPNFHMTAGVYHLSETYANDTDDP